jgi:hypothetical protein
VLSGGTLFVCPGFEAMLVWSEILRFAQYVIISISTSIILTPTIPSRKIVAGEMGNVSHGKTLRYLDDKVASQTSLEIYRLRILRVND